MKLYICHAILAYFTFGVQLKAFSFSQITFSFKHKALSHKNFTFVKSMLIPKAPMGRGWGGHIHNKA